jgi:hypothetical protein
MKKTICILIIPILFLCACKKQERYSDIPEIKFISFEKLNQYEGLLTFYFQDGEGDIGLEEWENQPPFEYNLFCDYYEKQNGVFVKVDSCETGQGVMIPFIKHGRIPKLSYLPEESINGEIYYKMSPDYYDIFSPYNDTIQYKFYIVDRKLNKSNVEEFIVIR